MEHFAAFLKPFVQRAVGGYSAPERHRQVAVNVVGSDIPAAAAPTVPPPGSCLQHVQQTMTKAFATLSSSPMHAMEHAIDDGSLLSVTTPATSVFKCRAGGQAKKVHGVAAKRMDLPGQICQTCCNSEIARPGYFETVDILAGNGGVRTDIENINALVRDLRLQVLDGLRNDPSCDQSLAQTDFICHEEAARAAGAIEPVKDIVDGTQL